jgi:hypothetical protein
MEWISIEDRLPERYESVLIYHTFEGGYIEVGCITDTGWYSSCLKKNKVTHWMELPNPPKET